MGDRVKKIVFSWKIKFRCFLPLLDSVARPSYWLQARSTWEGAGHSAPKLMSEEGLGGGWHRQGVAWTRRCLQKRS